MDLHSIARAAGSFQQPVAAHDIEALCGRALGADIRWVRAVELGLGTYNTTYRVEAENHPPVILRVAPTRSRQMHSDRDALRNEYAAAPYLTGLGSLVPRILAADFTHHIIDRDYLVQSTLAGVPAPDRLVAYPRHQWASLYRQLGTVTRCIHDVRGDRFGLVAGPHYERWSDALTASFLDAAADLADAGVDSDDVRRLADAADQHREILDDVEPRLLHGDLWHVNILIDADAVEPLITGICDSDRACWGDPMADWTIDRVQQRPGTEREAFWETYGPRPDDTASRLRANFYRARNMLGSRLDIHRRKLNIDEVPAIHWDLAPLVAALGATS